MSDWLSAVAHPHFVQLLRRVLAAELTVRWAALRRARDVNQQTSLRDAGSSLYFVRLCAASEQGQDEPRLTDEEAIRRTILATTDAFGLVGPDAQAMPSHTELSLRVLVKEGAARRIAAFHDAIVQR